MKGTVNWLMAAAVAGAICCAGIDLGLVASGHLLNQAEQETIAACLIVWAGISWTWFRRARKVRR